MTLISAVEDVQGTTLKAISGSLRRLEYVARLRGEEGGYVHWGLGRVYGGETAERALNQIHHSIVSQILSTPLRNLVGDAEQSSELVGVPTKAYLEQLSADGGHLLPASPEAGSARHLSSVLHALSSLLKNRISDANPPA